MRWPWVSREWYEDVRSSRASESASRQRAEDRYADLSLRYDALLEKYHALKIQGAAATPEKPVIQAKEPSPIDWAISEKSGSNAWLRVHLTRYAAEQRQQGKEDGEIIERITRWQSEDDD